MKPEEALAKLKEGNARFVSGRRVHPHTDAARRDETADQGQKPFAAVIGCSDSRVPVELIFDQGIGDLFVVRVPGNVCNGDEIGAVEYGVERLGAPLCVVMGHTKCGAVTDVVTGVEMHGHFARLAGNIRHALVKARRDNPNCPDEDLVEAATRANVEQSIADLLAGSAAIRDRAHAGELLVAGAIYDIATGEVAWIE